MKYVFKNFCFFIFFAGCFCLNSTSSMAQEPIKGTNFLFANDVGNGRNNRLLPGEYIVSPSGTFFFIMQHNGQAAIYAGSGPNHKYDQIWTTKEYGSDASLFTLTSNEGMGIWSTKETRYLWFAGGQDSNGAIYLLMQDDGNLVLYENEGKTPNPDKSGRAIWASGTNYEITIEHIENLQYDLKKATQSSPTLAATASSVNCNCNNVKTSPSTTLGESYTTSSSWKNTTSIAVSVSTTISVGVPEVASGSVTVGASATSSFSNGKVKSETKNYSTNVPIPALPNTKVKATLLISTSELTVPYTATATFRGVKPPKATDGGLVGRTINFNGPISGKYVGKSLYDARVSYSTPTKLSCSPGVDPCGDN